MNAARVWPYVALLVAPLLGACGHTAPEGPGGLASTPAPVGPPPNEPWRDQVPAPGPIEVPLPGTFIQSRLPNGMVVMVSQAKGLPVASVRLVTLGGAVEDPVDYPGLTQHLYAHLAYAPAERPSQLVIKGGDDLTGLRWVVARDHAYFATEGLAPQVEAMISLVAGHVRKPNFNDKVVEWIRDIRVEELKAGRGSPAALINDRFASTLYGADHPYSRPISGRAQALAELDDEILTSFYRQTVRPDQTALIVAGAVSADRVWRLADRYFGTWKVPKQPARQSAIPVPPPRARTTLQLIQRNNLSQVLICAERPLFGPDHPDVVPLLVLDELLGGGPSSRLHRRLREEKGYTYDAHSDVELHRGVGLWSVCARVRRAAAPEALADLVAEIDRLRTEPPSEDEIRAAGLGTAMRLSFRGQSVGERVGIGTWRFVHHRSGEALSQLVQAYQTIDPQDVLRVADSYARPEAFQVVLVGDLRGLRQRLAEKGLGRLVELK